MNAPYTLDASTEVAVIGAGSMGAGIAQLAAQSRHRVRVLDAQPGAATRALERIGADLDAGVQRGRIDAAEREAVFGRISVVESASQLAGCGLAVEAIVERLDAKKSLFRELEDALGADAVLATNTSSISVTAIAEGLADPRRVVGWHFFNPVTRMKLVEIIPGVETDPAVVAALHALSRAWGKTAVDAPNAPGFIVNRVARPYYAEGLRLLAERIAAPEAIDRVLRDAGGFALGPFELMDLIGNDVNLSVTESVFAATAWDSRYAPNIIQQELVRAGRFGRKSGTGFYRYADGARPPAAPAVAVDTNAAPASVAVATDMGLLGGLVERLRGAGLPIAVDERLTAETFRLGDGVVALTDGRTLAERRSYHETITVLLDLALDYANAKAVGATGSAESLGQLAALLAPAGLDVIALADVAGLAVMRIVCGLVNEAADVMTWTATRAQDIDTSMQLGTAYPRGPLAWGDAIGPARVAGVLANLQSHYGDVRYRRSPRLATAQHTGGTLHGGTGA
ncbi:3-hydroxyacyl-CoA dehydrogenase [Piscinibacter koreensis]|uniref:3-hydroxyacyl-CoA dehydrogenase n=1 Tax=Piscinibacter koreensis TaxID=2742824 RepID=A0A7Y6TVI5_9BURK|nr:3-hydroxyacyl-CoA dehydrogenase [Schlegelella koreensis]NUZ04971.1 3-hydroxyacyl-CoA dehydrogenase [Schlegelella koreensis]